MNDDRKTNSISLIRPYRADVGSPYVQFPSIIILLHTSPPTSWAYRTTLGGTHPVNAQCIDWVSSTPQLSLNSLSIIDNTVNVLHIEDNVLLSVRVYNAAEESEEFSWHPASLRFDG